MARGFPHRLSGTRDLIGDEVAALERLQSRLVAFLAGFGYERIDTPVIEPSELYLRKFGSQMTTMLYGLSDGSGARLSLRPEFTASAIRAYLERGRDLPLPLRWQYCGQVFRAQSSSERQFTQLGAELIGAASLAADAEVVLLAARLAAVAGLEGYSLVVGHLGLLIEVLNSFGLSERVNGAILNHLGELKHPERGSAYVKDALAEAGLLEAPRPELRRLIDALGEAEGRRLVIELLGSDSEPFTGSRDLDEVADRFLGKLRGADDPMVVGRALDLLEQLCRIRGAPAVALAEAEGCLGRQGIAAEALASLTAGARLLEAAGVPLLLDMGLWPGMPYYTGIVFELWHGRRRLGGGGRYDGLVRALGGDHDVPALGFAFNLNALLEAVASQSAASASASRERGGALVLPRTAAAIVPALRLADELRATTGPVELEVVERDISESLAYAAARGFSRVLVVDEQGGYATVDLEQAE